MGFACGFFTVCGILGAMAVRRYLQRYSDQSGLPMTIKTKMAKKTMKVKGGKKKQTSELLD